MSEQDVKALREAAASMNAEALHRGHGGVPSVLTCAELHALAIMARFVADQLEKERFDASQPSDGRPAIIEPTVQCDATYRLGWNAAIEAAKQACRCHAGKDGECYWEQCPQIRDGEPMKSARYCPYDNYCNDESCDAPNKIQTAISALRREPS